MKQTLITTLVIMLVTAGMLAAIVWGSQNKRTDQPQNLQVNDSTTATPEILSEDEKIASKEGELVFYYGNTCPHCKDVEEWMKQNNVEEKIKVVKKEVYDNRANALELSKVAQKCGLNTNSIGVPFLYTPEGKCLIGTPDIINYFSKKIKE